MDLQQLRYFLAVAESEHITNTARSLHIAQPALTQSIRRLEKELGVQLFERAGRNIRLTPTGAYLRDRVKPALDGLGSLAEEVRAFDAREGQTISVGIHAASGVAIDGIAAYSEANPHTAFRITQNENEAHRDVVVTLRAPGEAAIAGAAEQVDFTERIGVAVPLGSRFARAVRLDELKDERFICLAGSRRFREVCDKLCAARLFTPHIGFESDNPLVVKKIIGLGLGVGFWPEHSWGPLSGNARWAALEDEAFERSIAVAKTARGDENAEARKFYAFLTAYIERTWAEDARG